MNNSFLNDFFDYLNNQKRYSLHTLSSYKNDLQLFFDYLKKEHITEIDEISIQSYFSFLYSKSYSIKSISRKLSAIKSYGKYLTKFKKINCEFVRFISLPKKEKKLPEYLHESELNNILNTPLNNLMEIRNSLIVNLLYSTGLRLSELTSLKISDYNCNENVFKVKGKGNKERIVIYSKKSKYLLELYLKERQFINCDYLLINKNYKKLTNRGVELILNTMSKKYLGNDKLHPHILRHTFATNLLNKGMDIRTLQELLGHDSLNATQIYTHIAKNELLEIYSTYHPRSEINNSGVE